MYSHITLGTDDLGKAVAFQGRAGRSRSQA